MLAGVLMVASVAGMVLLDVPLARIPAGLDRRAGWVLMLLGGGGAMLVIMWLELTSTRVRQTWVEDTIEEETA